MLTTYLYIKTFLRDSMIHKLIPVVLGDSFVVKIIAFDPRNVIRNRDVDQM